MNAQLTRILERIDAANLRERVLLFFVLAMLLVLIVNSLLIEPLRDRQRRLSTETNQRQGELSTIQNELRRLAAAESADPNADLNRRAVALRAELAALESRVIAEQKRFTAPERVKEVLDEMLQRNKRLGLVELKTLPVSVIDSGKRVFRHGVELSVTGTYMELYDYLAALERLPTQIYWGTAEMEVVSHPVAKLRLVVYTVSLDRAWLVV
jgi:MSHA biogenesis protein MshJ